jgi:hypothetical protein
MSEDYDYGLDNWPEYHCKPVMNWASNPCETCGINTNWLYWTQETPEDVYVWHYCCQVCIRIRKQILESLNF